MTVGDRIRERREYLGISQIELAKRIHVLKQTLYKYEMNIITNIPSDKIEKMAVLLNGMGRKSCLWEVRIFKNDT